MSYEIEIIRKKDHHTSEWSGGATTELLIYPRDSIYNERNFSWRLSSAKVEADESVFTILPGISRIIMIIEGKLILQHEGRHKCLLKKFDQYSFSGEWNTKSYGKVTDFNLMMAGGCEGKLETISLRNEDAQKVLLDTLENERYSKITDTFYCANGEVEISTGNDENLNLNEGDLLVVTRSIKESLSPLRFFNTSKGKTEVIRSTICY